MIIYFRGTREIIMSPDNIDMLIHFFTYKDLSNLLRSLDYFSYAQIKGQPLSILAYGKTNSRKSYDIDILIPPNNIPQIERLLQINGFYSKKTEQDQRIFMLTSTHQTPVWIKDCPSWGGHINIDLNFDLFWGEYDGPRINIEEFLSDTIKLDLYGASVKTLPPQKAIVQLVLHHYKDMNSIFLLSTKNSINYNMFKDVYNLLMRNREFISVQDLFRISEKYNILPYMYYVLYYTNCIFDDDTFKQYVTALKTREGESLLNVYGLSETERKEWNCDFFTRLNAKSIWPLIKNELTAVDIEKIKANKHYLWVNWKGDE